MARGSCLVEARVCPSAVDWLALQLVSWSSHWRPHRSRLHVVDLEMVRQALRRKSEVSKESATNCVLDTTTHETVLLSLRLQRRQVAVVGVVVAADAHDGVVERVVVDDGVVVTLT